MNQDSFLQRFHERPFLPILILLFFMLLIGWVNSSFLAPFARPIVVADKQGAYAFYNAASLDNASKVAFMLRHTKDGLLWSREQRVSGRLVSAALTDDKLHLLFPTFLSTYQRGSLKRLNTISVRELPFEAAHLLNHDGQLLILGLDREQSLRMARVDSKGLIVLDSKIEQVTGFETVKKRSTDSKLALTRPYPRVDEFRTRKSRLNVQWSSTRLGSSSYVMLAIPPVDGGTLTGAFPITSVRSVKYPDTSEARATLGIHDPKTLRWFKLDGATVSKIHEVKDESLAASLFSDGQTLQLLRVTDKSSDKLEVLSFNPTTKTFEGAKELAYQRGGMLRNQGVSSLAVAMVGERRALLAQIGGTIRLHVTEVGDKPQWRTLAQVPGETKTLVYGWFLAVMTLVFLLIVSGVQSYRRRRLLWPTLNMKATEQELKTLIEKSAREAGSAESQRHERVAESEPRASEASAESDEEKAQSVDSRS